MPVILPPKAHETWLSPDTSPAEAKALLRLYEGDMIAYPVDKAVGSPKNDGPELIGKRPERRAPYKHHASTE